MFVYFPLEIKIIRLDNIGEFRSLTLNDYYMSFGIFIEYSVVHVNTQNGLVGHLSNIYINC